MAKGETGGNRRRQEETGDVGGHWRRQDGMGITIKIAVDTRK